ncbi:alpha/beta fold hydrolase [Nocardia nepalensis]|uniref:alpha/beta fold hydrolase n=1 Tax=Nocardia nepalensis TaxID=3375448 RepID=UPI003B682DCD
MIGYGRGLPLRSDERFDIAQFADDAAAVLDALGVDQVVVCGYSLGGPVGLEFARRHRDRVAGLVFGATALSFDSRADKMGRIAFRACPRSPDCPPPPSSRPVTAPSRQRISASWANDSARW